MTATCMYCRQTVETPIAIGIIEGGSGPGGTMWACFPCKTRRGVLALAEWETDSPDGSPQYRGTS